jgi:DNA-binding XRE family transcriptional regulator
MNYSHQVFDETNYYSALAEAMANAQGRVVFHTPFATVRRVQILRPHIESCIRRDVVVCSYLQRPRNWDRSNQPPELKPLEGAVDMLLSMGAHVTMKPFIHKKVVVIDNGIVDEGSLNVLSHFDTRERMTRWSSPVKVREVVDSLQLNDCGRCFENQPLSFQHESDVKEFLKSIGAEVAQARVRAGLAQDDIARQHGLTQKALSNIECARHDTRIGTVAKILAVTGSRLIVVPEHLLPAIQNLLREEKRSGARGRGSR